MERVIQIMPADNYRAIEINKKTGEIFVDRLISWALTREKCDGDFYNELKAYVLDTEGYPELIESDEGKFMQRLFCHESDVKKTIESLKKSWEKSSNFDSKSKDQNCESMNKQGFDGRETE